VFGKKKRKLKKNRGNQFGTVNGERNENEDRMGGRLSPGNRISMGGGLGGMRGGVHGGGKPCRRGIKNIRGADDKGTEKQQGGFLLKVQ